MGQFVCDDLTYIVDPAPVGEVGDEAELSNALRAAQARQPFFVVLVVAGGDKEAIYAKHFWRDEIERTLKRVRLAENAGDTQFNRRYFDLRMD